MKALAAAYKIKDGPNEPARCSSGRPAGRPFPAAVPQRAGGQGRQWRRRAARHVGRSPRRAAISAASRWFIFDIFTQYQEQGPDYIAAILNGYTHPDRSAITTYFPGHKIAMPPPLADGAGATMTDGTPPTLANYSQDVAAFLMWAAEPKLEARKASGFRSWSS